MLSTGDIVNIKSMKLEAEIMPGTYASTTVSANRKMVLVALMIGEQPLDGSAPVDVVAAMKELGWVPAKGRGK